MAFGSVFFQMTSAIENLIRLSKKPVVKIFSGAMFTQGLLSLTNFAVGLCVAKYAEKSEYGIYVILFSTLGIVGNYQNALGNNPLTVLIHLKAGDETRLL